MEDTLPSAPHPKPLPLHSHTSCLLPTCFLNTEIFPASRLLPWPTCRHRGLTSRAARTPTALSQGLPYTFPL